MWLLFVSWGLRVGGGGGWWRSPSVIFGCFVLFLLLWIVYPLQQYKQGTRAVCANIRDIFVILRVRPSAKFLYKTLQTNMFFFLLPYRFEIYIYFEIIRTSICSSVRKCRFFFKEYLFLISFLERDEQHLPPPLPLKFDFGPWNKFRGKPL